MKRKLFVVWAILMFAGIVQAQTVFTSGSWEEISEKAKKENKLIFVDLYFEGCMPCAEMDKKVFPDTTVGNLLNTNFVSFKTDVFKEDIGAILSMKYAASGFPTYLFLNAEGKTIDIVSGFMGVSRFVSQLQQVIDHASREKWLAYDERLDMDYPDFYRKAYMEHQRQVPQDMVDTYLATRSDLSDELSFVVMNTFRTGQEYSSFYLNNAQGLVKKYGRMPVRNRLSSLITSEGSRLGKENKAEEFEQMLAKIKEVFLDDEWTKFSSSFFNAYYEGSKDAEWMLGKLEVEQDTYVDWQDKSNVLAKVIIDAKDQPEVLEQIASLYKEALVKESTPTDLYKAALIQLYLKKYDQATLYGENALKGFTENFYLKKEAIEELLKAAKKQQTDGFEPVRAVVPKGFSLG